MDQNVEGDDVGGAFGADGEGQEDGREGGEDGADVGDEVEQSGYDAEGEGGGDAEDEQAGGDADGDERHRAELADEPPAEGGGERGEDLALAAVRGIGRSLRTPEA